MGTLVQNGRRVVVPDKDMAEGKQYLTFMLGGETFALRILNIREIIEYGSLTEVPMMPRFVRGVINLRGAVVPVVDLSARFGRNQAEITMRTSIVIIETVSGEESQDVGVMVDSVSEVLEIPDSEVEPPPAFGAKIRAEFISGMGKVNGKFVIILAADRVLSVDEMSALASLDEEALQA